ncbi:hypothetical protein D3C72_1375110 [compost metagenome]
MGGEGVDEQHLFTGLRMSTHHRVLGIGVLGLERQALFDRHVGTEAGFNAVPGAQAFNLLFHLIRQVLVCQDHVRPHGVTTHGRALHTAQHTAHGRCVTPGGVGVPGVLITISWLVRALVDLHQARMLRVAAGYWMVFQLTKAPGKCHMVGAANVLLTQEQHSVLEQLRTELLEQIIIVYRIGQVDPGHFGADGTGQLFDVHATALFR